MSTAEGIRRDEGILSERYLVLSSANDLLKDSAKIVETYDSEGTSLDKLLLDVAQDTLSDDFEELLIKDFSRRGKLSEAGYAMAEDFQMTEGLEELLLHRTGQNSHGEPRKHGFSRVVFASPGSTISELRLIQDKGSTKTPKGLDVAMFQLGKIAYVKVRNLENQMDIGIVPYSDPARSLVLEDKLMGIVPNPGIRITYKKNPSGVYSRKRSITSKVRDEPAWKTLDGKTESEKADNLISDLYDGLLDYLHRKN